MTNSSSLAPACAGCQWISSDPDQWCEMFRNTPEELPCSQHDNFKPIREAMVKSGMANLVVATAAFAAPLTK